MKKLLTSLILAVALCVPALAQTNNPITTVLSDMYKVTPQVSQAASAVENLTGSPNVMTAVKDTKRLVRWMEYLQAGAEIPEVLPPGEEVFYHVAIIGNSAEANANKAIGQFADQQQRDVKRLWTFVRYWFKGFVLLRDEAAAK